MITKNRMPRKIKMLFNRVAGIAMTASITIRVLTAEALMISGTIVSKAVA
jgi:hypothetical protein